ncbi:MAG: hypothetical protein IJ091_02335 [Oscillospiraceae bacterium]|nr:hypothetical protein [Oscillospiraceae bacterium]
MVGNYGKYYTVEGFLRKVKDYNVYVDKLSKRYLEFGYGEMGRSQEKAWEDCYSCLTAALESLPLGWKKKAYVIFEYVLPDHATLTRNFQN